MGKECQFDYFHSFDIMRGSFLFRNAFYDKCLQVMEVRTCLDNQHNKQKENFN